MSRWAVFVLYGVFGVLVGMATQSWEWGGVAAVGAVVGFTYAKIVG